MSWIDALKKIVGKRISGLVVARGPSAPRQQVFLVFDDGTYYELYGPEFRGCKDVDRGKMPQIREYLRGRRDIQVLLDCESESAPESCSRPETS